MYKCTSCGHIFEEGEQKTYTERHGLDTPPYEKYEGCPSCGSSDFEEVENCEICGELHPIDELHGGVCDDCIDKCRYDFKKCVKIGEREKEPIKINSFLAYMFDADEIESILYQHLKNMSTSFGVDCSDYIDSDKDWFGEELKAYENE